MRSVSFFYQIIVKGVNDTHVNNNTVSLTCDLVVPTSSASRALYSRPVRFRQPGNRFPASFTTFFSFFVTSLNPSSIGGGLTFVLSSDDDTIGEAGGFLGLSGGGGFVAVEFDTLMVMEFKDLNGNHVGVDLNNVVLSEVGDLANIEAVTSVDDGDLEGEGGEDDSVGGAGVEDAEEGEVEAKELEGEEFGGDSGAEEGGMVLGGGEAVGVVRVEVGEGLEEVRVKNEKGLKELSKGWRESDKMKAYTTTVLPENRHRWKAKKMPTKTIFASNFKTIF
ncbi:L-type lectin-domain containing receptor kinase VIII.2 [Glycine soja]